ncbi:hypothetical protein [Peribacillus frigoritolerans]|uniref:hypothetical protein n=1 Tax=Peribacillus castrilensis TaxID=2897690 RepID=UPI003DA36395
MTEKRIWIDNSIINWRCMSLGGTIIEEQKWRRAYIIWERAKVLIEKSGSEFDIGDGIANLKRSLNNRLKLIEEIYSFKLIGIDNKPKGYLEILEVFGIVRPLIMKKLLFIRNDIEHNDAKPPSLDRCLELLDVVWYFLKSTDSMVQIERCEADFTLRNDTGINTQYGYEIKYDFNKVGQTVIRGWFPIEYVSEKPRENHFEVITQKFQGKEVSNISNNQKKYHEDKLDSDIFIMGNPLFTSKGKLEIIPKILFSV